MSSSRLERLQQRLVETKTDLAIIGPSSHLTWVLNVHAHGDERPVMLLVTPTYAGLLVPKLNVESLSRETDLPMFPWSDDEGASDALSKLIAACGLGDAPAISLDEMMRADHALLVLDALPGAKRSFTAETLGYLRARKGEDEFKLLKASHLLNDAAMKHVFANLKEGMTEAQGTNMIAQFYKDHGASVAFLNVSFGPSGALPHHASDDTKLKKGDVVLVDIGCVLDGYPSDMTRVGLFGDAPEGFAELHAIVNAAVEAALAAAKPGVMAKQVDKAARDVITKAGYGEYFNHRTGHGLGIDIHEEPYITGTNELILDEGMVFSIEPGIYLPGKFGVRLEEIVYLRKDGPEIFSELSRDAL